MLGDVSGERDSTPRIAALRSGAEFMVVHHGRYTTREAGEWAPLVDIPGMGPSFDSSVAALRDGRTVVVWLRVDGIDVHRQFYSMYDPAARTWTPSTEYSSARVAQPPLVAAGAAGDEFFLAYTYDGTGDSTILFRFDGPDVDQLADSIFDQNISLASRP